MREYFSTHALVCFIFGLFIGSVLHCTKIPEYNPEPSTSEIKKEENSLASLSGDQYDFIRYNDMSSVFFNPNSSNLVESEKTKIKEYLSLFTPQSIQINISSYCDKSESISIGKQRLDSVKKELPQIETIKEDDQCTKVYPHDDKETLNRKVTIKIVNVK